MNETEAKAALERMEAHLERQNAKEFYDALVTVVTTATKVPASIQSRAYIASWVEHVSRLTDLLGEGMLKLVPETQAFQVVILSMAIQHDILNTRTNAKLN